MVVKGMQLITCYIFVNPMESLSSAIVKILQCQAQPDS